LNYIQYSIGLLLAAHLGKEHSLFHELRRILLVVCHAPECLQSGAGRLLYGEELDKQGQAF
jgi:hypothetical protein